MKKIDQDEYFTSLPRKRMASGVLFFNKKQEVLLVKPNYKEGWGIPGGVVDENESPLQAAIREVKEELNLAIPSTRLSLVCLGYSPQAGIKTEALQFTFYGGELLLEQIQTIVLQEEELVEYAFFKKSEATSMFCNQVLANRVERSFEAIEKNTFFYLES